MLNLILYLPSLIGVVTVLFFVAKVPQLSKKRKHNKCMANIAKLELELGFGIDYSADWLKEQKPVFISGREYTMIAKLECRVCHREFHRNGLPENQLTLCPRCKEKIKIADRRQKAWRN